MAHIHQRFVQKCSGVVTEVPFKFYDGYLAYETDGVTRDDQDR